MPFVVVEVPVPRKPKEKIPAPLRWKVWERDGFACHYCGIRGKPLSVDHKVPESKGGTLELDNLLAACGQCNRKKGSLSYKRYIIRREYRQAIEHIIETEGSFSFSKDNMRRAYNLAYTGYILKIHPDMEQIKTLDPSTGKTTEYWINVTKATTEELAELIADRRSRQEWAEAERFAAMVRQRSTV